MGAGFDPTRTHALRCVLGDGRGWCVDVDLKSYFDTIPHDRLMTLVKQRIVDGSVLTVLAQSLKAGVLEDGRLLTVERGTPQGAVISPVLANIWCRSGSGWKMKAA